MKEATAAADTSAPAAASIGRSGDAIKLSAATVQCEICSRPRNETSSHGRSFVVSESSRCTTMSSRGARGASQRRARQNCCASKRKQRQRKQERERRRLERDREREKEAADGKKLFCFTKKKKKKKKKKTLVLLSFADLAFKCLLGFNFDVFPFVYRIGVN
jgi:hypothetical protein